MRGSGTSFPDLVSSQISDKGPIFRSLSATLSSPGTVEVEYWSGNAPHLTMHGSATAALTHHVALPRLRANTAYNNVVRSVTEGRRRLPLAEGNFVTADLPADIKAMNFTASGTPGEPLTFMSVRSAFTGGLIIDGEGQVVWYGRTSVAPQGATRRGGLGCAVRGAYL